MIRAARQPEAFRAARFFIPPTFGLVCNRVQLYFCHSHVTAMLMVLWLPRKSQKISRRQRRRKPHFERFSSFKTPIFPGLRSKLLLRNKGVFKGGYGLE